MNTLFKRSFIAAGVVVLSAVPAAAAVVTNDLNLRRGPGTGYNVITAMPAGARVDVGSCTGNWCRLSWRGHDGYASASYLSGEGRAYRPAPAYTYPRYGVRDYRGYGYRRGVHLSFRLGDDDRWDRRRWRRHHRWD